jgi:quercetin dioxygenase-like cupin family protein
VAPEILLALELLDRQFAELLFGRHDSPQSSSVATSVQVFPIAEYGRSQSGGAYACRDRLHLSSLRGGGDMSEESIQANEADFAWESDEADADAPDVLRWRVFVSAGRTATSGISMGTFEVPPGAELAPHTHHPQEVYFVVAGEAEVFGDGEWRPLRCGDVVYFPSDAVHGVRNRGQERISIVWMFPADSYDEIEYVDA